MLVRLRGHNLSNGRPLDADLALQPLANGVLVRYSDGLKRSTAFAVEPVDGQGATLRITDDYSGWKRGREQGPPR